MSGGRLGGDAQCDPQYSVGATSRDRDLVFGGARPRQVFGLFILEATFYGRVGALLGYLVYRLALWLSVDWLLRPFELDLQPGMLGLLEWGVLIVVTLAVMLVALTAMWRGEPGLRRLSKQPGRWA